MFTHILAPLDGSRMAEAALPAAEYMARKLGATVTLFHVLERRAPKRVHGERHLREEAEAEAYLAEAAARAFPPGTALERHVHGPGDGTVAESIVNHAQDLHADLVVLCTHGQGRMRTLLFGSIAQDVAAMGKTPVLLIPPDGARDPFAVARILAPLDGDPAHEAGLEVAVGLARALKAALRMVLIVPTKGTLRAEQAPVAALLPGATAAALELARGSGEAYLEARRAALSAPGLDVSWEVARGRPDQSIVKAAQRAACDLIVLGTHAPAGGAFWAGSVAPRVSARSRTPLLLVPLAKQ